MTSDMQLAQAAGLPVAARDGYGSLAAGINPPGHAPAPTGLKKIHRLLRGRYPLVIGLGAVLGITGALFGYFGKKPMYESDGRIYLSPTIPSARSSTDEMLPGYSTLIHSQAAVIDSRDMVQLALKNPKWAAIGGSHDDGAVDDFYSNLDVEEMANTSLIRIGFSDPDPRVAQVGATVMCEAYQDFYESEDPLLLTHKINQLDSMRGQIGNDLQLLEAQLSDLSKKYGSSDLGDFSSSQMQQLAHLDAEMSDAEQQYKEAQAAVAMANNSGTSAGSNLPSPDGAKPTDSTGAVSETQIANLGDLQMRSLISQRIQLTQILQRMQREGFGPNHPAVQSAQDDLDVLNSEIQQYVETWNKNYRLGTLSGLTPVVVNLQANLEATRLRMNILKDQHDRQDALCHEIGQQMEMIREVQDKISSKTRDLEAINQDFDALNSQKSLMSGQLEIISEPSIAAEPAHDKRLQYALLGLLGGGFLPAGVVVLIGLLDGRLRYSDETHADLGGVHLLGILPNLPDLLTDPDQAATAAHCVHQIRTILQITGHNLDRRAFTVTSGSSGDGKTSLTLALGLSFAASGSRTLMIDGDLVGGGLTARLAITTEHGVLEAMASRDILPLVHNTDVTDLFLLPVGRAMGGYTGSIAPASVRKLMLEARNHFDVIIIDTGPILGSIEASPMAVAADGVILCVSRGQQRHLVDRALAHLHAIGAKLAGVVFNRAQAQDFEKSMSRMSLHPMGGANGNGDRIGPVVTAVASSVRSGLGSHGEHS
ncbi:MAG: AAA family ATPase [Tepidisphaeraceae bacterium]|jgi:capsular exopolysaccharide synthesis family protein